MTILDVAAAASVSAGMISQIERGNSNPSIGVLQKICAALSVSLWDLLEEPRQRDADTTPPFVRRHKQRPRMVLGDTGLIKELLSPQYAESLRFMFISVKSGGFTEEMLIGPGYKAGYVVSGSVELIVGEYTVTLDEGDSFQFGSDVYHQIANRSADDAKLLWIISAVDTRI